MTDQFNIKYFLLLLLIYFFCSFVFLISLFFVLCHFFILLSSFDFSLFLYLIPMFIPFSLHQIYLLLLNQTNSNQLNWTELSCSSHHLNFIFFFRVSLSIHFFQYLRTRIFVSLKLFVPKFYLSKHKFCFYAIFNYYDF